MKATSSLQNTCVIYTRVSTAAQESMGTSLADQLTRCRAAALRLGLTVLSEHQEDASGALLERPGLMAGLRQIEEGQARVLLATSIDRLSRNVEHQQVLLRRTASAGGRIVFADLTLPEGPEGSLMLNLMGGFAEYERMVITLRTKRGKAQRAREGRQVATRLAPLGYYIVQKADVLSGRYPAGSEGTYQLDPERVPLIQSIFERYASGETLGDISGDLNRRGVAPAKGGDWHRPTLQNILKNTTYKGEAHFTPRGQEPIVIPCPAIVSAEVWNRCQERRERNRALSGARGLRHLFSGMVHCPVCGRVCNYVGAPRFAWRCRSYAAPTLGVPRRCGNAAGQKDAVLVGALRRLLVSVFEHPTALAAALAAAQTPPQEDQDAAQAQEALKKLNRERATLERGHLSAVRAGASGEVYEAELERVAREIGLLEQKLSQRPKQDSTRALTELVSRLSAFPLAVLDDPDITEGEKAGFVARLIDAVILRGDEVEFQSQVGTTVVSMWIPATDINSEKADMLQDSTGLVRVTITELGAIPERPILTEPKEVA